MNQIQQQGNSFRLYQAFHCLLLVLLASTGLVSVAGIATLSGDVLLHADIRLSAGEFVNHTANTIPCSQGIFSPDNQSATHESSYRDLPLLCKTDNTSRRVPEEYQACRVNRVWIVPGIQGDLVIPSTSLVSSHLGRQYTLVGAKPSGTS